MKNTIDFYKIENNLGAINFNNMIPVRNDVYTIIDLSENSLNLPNSYFKLLQKQYYTLIKNYKFLKKKSYRLYFLYKTNKLPLNVMNRCCNFILLEQKSKNYMKETIKE